jgi:hypothetical protein
VVFVVDQVALARFLSQYFGFPLSLSFQQRSVLTCISTPLYEKGKGRSFGILQQRNALSELGEHLAEKYFRFMSVFGTLN